MIRRLAKGVGANAFGQLVNTGIQLAIVPVLASHWGLERYGTWLMIVTVPFYLLVSDLGFARACAVDMTMKMTRGDTAGALITFQTTFVFVLCMDALLFAAAGLICALLPDWMLGSSAVPAHEVRWALGLMSCYGVLIISATLFSGGYQGSGNYAVESAIASCVLLVEGVSAMVVAATGGSLVAVAVSYLTWRAIGTIARGIVMHFLAHGIYVGFRHASRARMSELLRPALAIMAVPMAQAFVLQGTALAIGWAASPATVPVFTTTRTLTRFGMQIVGTVTNATMPEFSMASAAENRTLQIRLILLILGASALVLLPIALLLLAAGPAIIAFWTHDIVHVSRLMVTLMVAVMIANGSWSPVSNMIVAVNRQGLFTPIFVVLAILSAGLAYVLALRLGAEGGAIAMLSVDVIMCVVIARIITRLFATPRQFLEATPGILHEGRGFYKRFRSR
jgi:O-antigen/teichoic acid export membrane protein